MDLIGHQQATSTVLLADPLGILACAGPLPIEIAEAATRQGRTVHIVAIASFADKEVGRYPHEWVSLGELGRMLDSFRRAQVGEIVIAGAMKRPDLLKLKIDWGFVRHIPTILALTKGGDDSVLRRVVRFFETQGLKVVGAGDVAPGLLAPSGTLSRQQPGSDDNIAIARGAALIGALGPFDIGQAVVARANGIVAVEGVRGTDAMLRDVGGDGAGRGVAGGAVLVKLAKPGQEMRIDLPTIGPETVKKAHAAGLAGVVVGARGAIVLERSRVVDEADAAGIFVTGLDVATVEAEAAKPAAETTVAALTHLHVAARRAPTPADRRDIGIGRRLMAVLKAHGAGRAAVVSREHVLAVAGKLPITALVGAQERTASWGRRAWRRRLGVLVVDRASEGASIAADLDAALFRAMMASGLAGIAVLDALPEGEAGEQICAWANEAGVFLMTEETRS